MFPRFAGAALEWFAPCRDAFRPATKHFRTLGRFWKDRSQRSFIHLCDRVPPRGV